MNTLKNKVQLIGHVGQTPEIKNLNNGNKMARFSLATNDSYINAKGEKVEQTYWHNLVAWGKTAELIENYVEKGNQVAVEGKLVNRSYETDKGEKRFITEVSVNEIMFLTKK
jgi:single-strand DNA-binding protein